MKVFGRDTAFWLNGVLSLPKSDATEILEHRLNENRF